MTNLTELTEKYLKYCKEQRILDNKTIKAYEIDLNQFCTYFCTSSISDISINDIEIYLAHLHKKYKPKTVKRKVASIKALYHYLEYQDFITENPFNKIRINFKIPQTLP